MILILQILVEMSSIRKHLPPIFGRVHSEQFLRFLKLEEDDRKANSKWTIERAKRGKFPFPLPVELSQEILRDNHLDFRIKSFSAEFQGLLGCGLSLKTVWQNNHTGSKAKRCHKNNTWRKRPSSAVDALSAKRLGFTNDKCIQLILDTTTSPGK